MLARYYYHELGYKKTGIINALQEFMENNYPRYHREDWADSLQKYANRAPKYPLCKCSGIWITKQELHIIEEIQNKVLERLAFTLLCLAKFHNFRNGENHNWVTNPDSEIYKLACITTTALDKDIRFNQLRERGLIDFAKKINNLNVQVLYIKEDSEQTLFISDFRKLGYEWRLYKGENYVRCTKCGVLVRKTSLNRKYCKDCAKQNPYYSPMIRKTITCMDCGKEFQVEPTSRVCRCEECKGKHKKEVQKMKMRRYRRKTAV